MNQLHTIKRNTIINLNFSTSCEGLILVYLLSSDQVLCPDTTDTSAIDHPFKNKFVMAHARKS